MSLFVLASKDGWVDIMYNGLDAVGVDQQVIIWTSLCYKILEFRSANFYAAFKDTYPKWLLIEEHYKHTMGQSHILNQVQW